MLSHAHAAYKKDMWNSLGYFAIASFLKASEQILFFSGFLSKLDHSNSVLLMRCNNSHTSSVAAPLTPSVPAGSTKSQTCPSGSPFVWHFFRAQGCGHSWAAAFHHLATWETPAPTACFRTYLLTECLADSPETISRYLVFRTLYRLWIASRQGNEDSPSENQIYVSQGLFATFFH